MAEENHPSFIPEFFFEFIARIVPGLVLLAAACFLFHGDFSVLYAYATAGNTAISSLGTSGFLLVVAWIFGVVLDVGLFTVVKLLPLKKCPPPFKNWIPSPEENETFLKTILTMEPWKREAVYKMKSLGIFYRSMGVICALIAIARLSVGLGVWTNNTFRGFAQLPWWIGWVFTSLAVVFYLCWNDHGKSVGHWWKIAAKTKPPASAP